MKMNWRTVRFPRLEIVLAAVPLAALLAVAPGCQMVKTTAEIPGNVARTMGGGKETKPPPDPVILQQELFRFADKFTVQANLEFARVLEQWPDAPEMRLLESRLVLNARMLELSSGPNAFANLVDMVFAVMIARHQVRLYAAQEDRAEILRPTVTVLEEYQSQIMNLAKETLGEEQQQTLRENIKAWVDENVTSDSGLHARYTGSVSDLLGKGKSREGEPSSLLGMLIIDPFAALDPTVREITEARLFAERALYVAQRMPKILQMEIDLIMRRTLATPEVARLLGDVNSLGVSVDRISTTVAVLPDRLRAEREELVKTLKEEREGLTVLVQETRGTLDAGSKALENANAVVLSTDAFVGHLGIYDKKTEPSGGEAAAVAPGTAPSAPPAEPAAPAEPFRIQDYTVAAAQLAETSDHLNTLITTLDRTLATATSDEVAAKVDAASQTAVARGRDIVDHAFWRGLLFVALCCLMVLGSVLAFRFLTRKVRA
jgi:hypothetical protein